MANGPRYRVALRRRREGKTNFYRRKELLKSRSIRLVIRKSTKNIRVQMVESLADGDKTLTSASSMNLSQFGWNINGGNIPAAYLTGYLAGKKALKSGIDFAILDLGVQNPQNKTRLFACLKGVIDAGIEIPAGEDIFPDEEIIKGSHIAKYSEALKKEDNKLYKQRYAGYLKAKQAPEKIASFFDKTVKAIDKEF